MADKRATFFGVSVMRRKISPEKVTFLHLLGANPPRGWRAMQIYSLGITDCSLASLRPDADRATVEAHSYFYKGFHEPYYPHIISLTREPLVLMLMGVYVAKGWKNMGEEDAITRQINDFVRPTWGFVNSRRTYVVPAPGDSRVLWEGPNHKIRNKDRIPRAVKLLSDKVFRRLTKANSKCFLEALGHHNPA